MKQLRKTILTAFKKKKKERNEASEVIKKIQVEEILKEDKVQFPVNWLDGTMTHLVSRADELKKKKSEAEKSALQALQS